MPEMPEENLDNVFLWFVQNYLSNWLAVLFFVAVSSAIISTAGDTILTGGALIGYTAYGVIRPDSTDSQRLLVTRLAMLGFTACGLLFGLSMGNLYNLLVFAGAVAFPVTSAMAVCGVPWKKANVPGAWALMITGIVSWILLVFLLLPEVEGEVWDAIYIGGVPAFVLSLTAMILVSLATQTSHPPGPILDVDGKDISATKRFR